MSRAETLQKSAITVKNQKLYSILFTMNGVEELRKKAFILTCIVLIIAAVVGYYCSCVEQQEELQTANKCENIYKCCFALSHSFFLWYNYISV